MLQLPSFPWDSIAAAKQRAQEHSGQIVDLSIGTPVDPTPAVAQQALAKATNSPGYPTTAGTDELRFAQSDYLFRRFGVQGLSPNATLPVIGSKEAVAHLPFQLGIGATDVVVFPSIAYPTYAIGTQLAGAEPLAADQPGDVPQELSDRVRLVWLNSPSNPTGKVLSATELRDWVQWARARNVVIIADECYAEFCYTEPFTSLLDPQVAGSSHDQLLVLYSLSKRSNMAGYRSAFLAGDQALIEQLLLVRKHSGLIMPGPIQAASVAALDDQVHVDEQVARYRHRREVLLPALARQGFMINHSEAGLYLWATRQQDCQLTVEWFADRGILVAPGSFYGTGPKADQFVRIALTATDERIEQAAERLS